MLWLLWGRPLDRRPSPSMSRSLFDPAHSKSRYRNWHKRTLFGEIRPERARGSVLISSCERCRIFPTATKIANGNIMTVFPLLYGVLVYLLSVLALLYTIAFVGNLPAPTTIDTGATGSVPAAVAIDVLLVSLFAIQHSVMARPAFKRVWTKFVPHAVE